MAIDCGCPACGANLKVAEKHAGRKVKCPKCAGAVAVPNVDAPKRLPVAKPMAPPRRPPRTAAGGTPPAEAAEVIADPGQTGADTPERGFANIVLDRTDTSLASRLSESKHARLFRQYKLEPDETIVASAPGYIGKMMAIIGDDRQHNGALVVTDRRVAFYRKGVLGEVFETIPLKNITSVEQKSLLGHRVVRIHTSHDDLEFKSFDKQAYNAIVAAIDSGRKSASLAGRVSAPAESALDKLRKLGELHKAGVLSDEDFEAKKRELLDEL